MAAWRRHVACTCVGAHPVRDALAPFRAGSLRLPSAAELLSLCVAKEKVTKEKGHPAWRLPPIHGRQVRESGPGFSTGLLPWRKGVDILVDSRCAACRPRLTAAQGPRVEQRAIMARTRWKAEELKSRSPSHSKAIFCCGCAVDLALLKSARRERAALRGAPMARRVGGGKAPQGWLAGRRASSTSGQEPCRRTPVAHPRTRRAGCPQGAPSGWPSLWLLSLGQARESDSPSAGGRKLFAPKEIHAEPSRLKSLPQVRVPC